MSSSPSKVESGEHAHLKEEEPQQQQPEYTSESSPDFDVPSSFSIFFGLICNIFSTILYLVDIASNVFIAYVFYTNSFLGFSIFTILLVLVPAVLVFAAAGWRQELQVIRKAPRTGRLLSLLLLAPVIQSLTVIIMGLKTVLSRGNLLQMKVKYRLLVKEHFRYAEIKLIYAVYGAALQSTLQFYILFYLLNEPEGKRPYNIPCIQSIVIGISILNIAETLTRFHRFSRILLYVVKGEKQILMSLAGTIVVFLIHLCANAAGIFPTILLIAVKYWMVFVIMAYGVVRSVCFKLTGLEHALQLAFSSSGFGLHGQIEQIVAGMKLKTVAYIISLIESTAFLIVWCFLWGDQTSNSLTFRYSVIGGYYAVFFMGLFSVFLYSKLFHVSFKLNEVTNQFKRSLSQPEQTIA